MRSLKDHIYTTNEECGNELIEMTQDIEDLTLENSEMGKILIEKNKLIAERRRELQSQTSMLLEM